MKIAITDTNIFISLIRMDLLDRLFEIGYEIHTTEHVLEELTEIQKQKAEVFVKRGLLIKYSFQADEIIKISELSIPAGLAFVDRGLYYYSKQGQDYLLLTSDNLLRKTSQKNGIAIHGILWLLDTFLASRVATKEELYQGLTKLTQGYHRLPQEECNKRLKAWFSL